MKNIRWYVRSLDLFFTYLFAPFMVVITIINLFDSLPELEKRTHSFYSSFSYSWDSSITFLSDPFFLQILCVIVQAFSLLLLIIGFIYFKYVLQCYQHGEIFSEKVFFYFSKMSKYAFLWVLYTPFEHALMSLIKTFYNPPGQRIVSITICSSDITYIFVVGFLFFVSSLIYEGYKLKKDQDLTV